VSLIDLKDQTEESWNIHRSIALAEFLKQRYFPSTRKQRELDGSRPSILSVSGYRTVREREPVSLTLSDHLFNFSCQELIDLPGIIDLAAAF
jgi:hypothetical protein